MPSNNIALYGAKVLFEISRDFFYFPIWWYSQGLFYFVKNLLGFLSGIEKSLALWVWIKNIHKPMYQQHDWQGWMISIFMRIVQIILRSLVMLVFVIISLALLLAWIVIPFYVFYQIFFQLFIG